MKRGQLSVQYIVLVAIGALIILFSIGGFTYIYNWLNSVANVIDVYRQTFAGGLGG